MTATMDISTYRQTRLLDDFGDLEIWQLGPESLDEFNQYITEIYYPRAGYPWQPGEFEKVIQEHSDFSPYMKLCGMRNKQGQLVGTWGLILKDLQSENQPTLPPILPIESKFGVDLREVNRQLGTEARFFFNGFRTAIHKQRLEEAGYTGAKSIQIFDMLLRGLTEDFHFENNQFVGVSEMENIVLRYHRRVGIPWKIVGAPKNYWGLEIFPCAFSMQSYCDHLAANHPGRYEFVFGKREKKSV